MKKWMAVLAFVLGFAGLAGAQRLPGGATPQKYQLTIAPNFEKENFAGEETIEVRLEKPTTSITLNALEITFEGVSITSAGETQTAKVTLDDKKEQATLAVEKPLAVGPATIRVHYTGILNGQMRGLYLSKADGRKYAVSQLENTDARRMFPSFDEPAYKAAFDLTAIVDKGDTGISNGKIISDTPGPGEGKHTLKFATSPKMSSYLVALAVGDWKCMEGSADDIPIRVCGVPDKAQYGGFALEAAEASMKFYNRYFAIKYPYGKLDILGVADFAAGAMENTGCIIARDLLFVDPKGSSYLLRKVVAQQLVAHEMAHQWFGDLVTMKWWDDVWLNEGFATWMAFKPTEAFKPEWNIQTDAVSSMSGAMATDALSSTRAIEAHAETPAEIQELFDSIAYNKAAAVLSMVEGYVGPENFRAGVNSYLEKYKYANATSEDFWNEITKVTHQPVDRIMSGFVKQPGVPLVTMKTKCEGGKTHVALTQQRYFADRKLLDAGSKEAWEIPVCLKDGKAEKCALLAAKEQPVVVEGCGAAVYGNAGARGYYRSGYDAENFNRVAAAARELSPGERYLLLDDTSAQIAVNRLPAGAQMDLIQSLKDDPSTVVMDLMTSQLQYVGDYLVTDANRAAFQSWVRATFGPSAEKIGWTTAAGDSDETRQRRADLLTIVGYVGRDPKAIEAAKNLTQQAMKGETADRTMLLAALPIAVRDGDAAMYDAIVGHFPQVKTPEEYLVYGLALTQFGDPALLTRTLMFAISPMMRAQDAPQVIGSVMGNPAGRQVAWDFVQQHWPEVEAKLSNYSEAGIVSAASVFCSASKHEEVEKFFTEHKVPASERTLKLTLEQIDSCTDVRTNQAPNLQTWLQSRSGGAGAAGAGAR
ncbi:MAG TPA: M1 family metallopeptidase [Candidatus Limnocylindrales bacterium]|nr:M1 family metallopeptidase [Candidatus Limnocylindrales bacterium]